MAIYGYICDACGHTQDHERSMLDKEPEIRCEVCDGPMRRDFRKDLPQTPAETHEVLRKLSGGVLPNDVARANRHPEYRRLGVRFSPDGAAHIPSKSYDEFREIRGVQPRTGS
jgi:putative FmdB family regulatory protein